MAQRTMMPNAGGNNYYSEEKSLDAARDKNSVLGLDGKTSDGVYKKPGTGGPKLYGRELREYEDKDIEGILSKLTTDELNELNNDLDPDNSSLPPSQRCRYETTKEPTGWPFLFSRDVNLPNLGSGR